MEKDSSGNSTCKLSFLVKNCICFELSSACASQKVTLSCILRKQNKKRNFAPGALIQCRSHCEVVVPVWAGSTPSVGPCRDCCGHLTPPAVPVLQWFVPVLQSRAVPDQGCPVTPCSPCCPCWNVCSWAVLVLPSIPPLHRGCSYCSVCPGRDMKTRFKLRAWSLF